MRHAKRLKSLVCLVGLTLAFVPASPAFAYIGPGVGAGTIAAVLGVLAALAMIVVAVVWYPVKRLIKAMRSRDKDPSDG